MTSKRQNTVFQLAQIIQLTLLSGQGLLLIFSKSKELYAPIWIGLALCALAQFLIVFTYPKQVEMAQLVDRSAMLRLRLVAMIPYALILVGLLVAL